MMSLGSDLYSSRAIVLRAGHNHVRIEEDVRGFNANLHIRHENLIRPGAARALAQVLTQEHGEIQRNGVVRRGCAGHGVNPSGDVLMFASGFFFQREVFLAGKQSFSGGFHGLNLTGRPAG